MQSQEMKKLKNFRSVKSYLMCVVWATIAYGCAGHKNETFRSPESTEKPNIILIYVDDMGIGDASYTGSELELTPNIDRLAKNGKIFTKYYTTAPVCSPSRVGVLTGNYHIRWGINTFLNNKKFNRNTKQQDYLDSMAPTLGKLLKKTGYKTAHYGKWHLGGGRDVTNAPPITAYGFDDYVSTYESPDPDPLLTSTNWISAPSDSIKRWERTAYFVDKTIDFIKQNKTPCFVNLWPDDVHTPWVPSQEVQKMDRKKHFTLPNLKPVIREFDRQMGRLLVSLEEMGELENTLIVFTSDNGPSPSFSRVRTNGLRGVKNSLYEGGINMPMIVHWPAKIKKEQIDSTSIIASIDLLPTFASLLKTKLPENYKMDGIDFSNALLKNETRVRTKNLYLEYGRNSFFRFPQEKEDVSLPLAVRSGDWKLFSNGTGDTLELYNLRTDINETTNVVSEHPKLGSKLRDDLLLWFQKTDKSHVKKEH